MLLFHEVSFSKLKWFIDIVAKFFLQTCGSILFKRDITFSDLFKSTNLEYLHGFYVLKKSVFLNCIPIENEFHSLIYTGIFSDSQNFRRVISISLNSELVPDYLIVTLLPPGGVFRF